MLGGLARWLRILGQEVRYESNALDKDLLRIAREESMILLTRDGELYRRALASGVVSLLVSGGSEVERLVEISGIFGLSLDVDMVKTRCPECGSTVNPVSKNELDGEVPAASLKLYNEFWKCRDPGCGKVYWIGSHWKQIRRTLDEAKKLASMKER
jgi:uncharacterized protein with PIN domain